jgi:hypothetical protein
MKLDTGSFISAEYRPSNMVLKDPRNMHLDDIRKVLQHCYGLQAKSGPESSFRFGVFIGPKRKRLFANYPDTPDTRGNKSKPSPRKKKSKGKQREDPLEGLLQIDELVEPPSTEHIEIEEQQNTNPSVAGPSNKRSRNIPEPQPSVASHQNAMVRIDMGQMLQLKDMGYEILGPVNGPNEGYPEYEVPKTVLQMLISHRQLDNVPEPNKVDNPKGPSATDPGPILIDPALRQAEESGQQIIDTPNTTSMSQDGATDQSLQQSTTAIANPLLSIPHSSGSNVRPTTAPNDIAGSVNNTQVHKTPKKRLGKRAQANLSPQAIPQTQNNNKKKKITDDDLAAIEAQNMVQSGSRRRIKPTRRQ